jgi:fructose-bisphosphate aldolase class II
MADVPVAVHVDHAESVDLVCEAVELGLSSVMFDASRLPYDENVAATRDITTYCHDSSAWVEAELGEVGGKDGAHAPGVRTDPGDARASSRRRRSMPWQSRSAARTPCSAVTRSSTSL